MTQEALHETLEQEIHALADELRGKQTAEMTSVEAREVIKAALHERMKRVDIGVSDAAPTPAPNAVASTATPGGFSAVLPLYANDLPREQQLRVEQLIDVALHQGLAVAVAGARKFDPIILDVLHDALAGKLYNLIKERGLL